MKRIVMAIKLTWWTYRAAILRDKLKRAHLRTLQISDAHKAANGTVDAILRGLR